MFPIKKMLSAKTFATKTFSALLFSAAIFTASHQASADEIYQQQAVDLCQNLKQSHYSKKCLAEVKQAKFDALALSHCEGLGSWNKIKSCLSLIKNNHYQTQAFAICQTAKSFNSEFKKCMKEIANKHYVSAIELGLCQQEKSLPKRNKCLVKASAKPYEEVAESQQQDDSKALAELRQQVQQAYQLLRENKTSDATILLHDLVSGFKAQQTSSAE